MSELSPIQLAAIKIKTYIDINLPDFGEGIGDPASPKEIQRAVRYYEEQGISLPKELMDLFNIFNGSGYVFPTSKEFVAFYGTNAIEGIYEDFCTSTKLEKLVDNDRVYSPVDGDANKLWIPIAFNEAGHDLYIDLCPGPKGRLGQIVESIKGEAFQALAPSLTSYMQWLANAIEVGDYSRVDDTAASLKDLNFRETIWKNYLETQT